MDPRVNFDRAFTGMLTSRDPHRVWSYSDLDRTGITERELRVYDQRLFRERWHQLHDQLATNFQYEAHPDSAAFLFAELIGGEIPEFDYKPISRKCVWALADIGTEEARSYLLRLAGGEDEILAGYARKRLDNWGRERSRKGRKIKVSGSSGNRIELEPYLSYKDRLPQAGRHLVAYHTEEEIVVYQAYNHAIADFAVANQQFGGAAFSYNRMSWIKPNFLWMMYRCGWGQKTNQERVLAIYLRRKDWEDILQRAVFSSFQPDIHQREETWRASLANSEVRLQWDPDHDPYGNPLRRKAIQIGIKGQTLRRFGTEMVQRIVDITPFVLRQKLYVDRQELQHLEVPRETVLQVQREQGAIGL